MRSGKHVMAGEHGRKVRNHAQFPRAGDPGSRPGQRGTGMERGLLSSWSAREALQCAPLSLRGGGRYKGGGVGGELQNEDEGSQAASQSTAGGKAKPGTGKAQKEQAARPSGTGAAKQQEESNTEDEKSPSPQAGGRRCGLAEGRQRGDGRSKAGGRS